MDTDLPGFATPERPDVALAAALAERPDSTFIAAGGRGTVQGCRTRGPSAHGAEQAMHGVGELERGGVESTQLRLRRACKQLRTASDRLTHAIGMTETGSWHRHLAAGATCCNSGVRSQIGVPRTGDVWIGALRIIVWHSNSTGCPIEGTGARNAAGWRVVS